MQFKKKSGVVGAQSPLLRWVCGSEQYGAHAIGRLLRHKGSFKKALDLGAGTGRDLEIIRKSSPGVELFGIEFDAQQCAILKSQGVKTYQVDLESSRLPFEDEYFDIVIINQVLEHIKDIFFILHETARVLKTGGYVLRSRCN